MPIQQRQPQGAAEARAAAAAGAAAGAVSAADRQTKVLSNKSYEQFIIGAISDMCIHFPTSGLSLFIRQPLTAASAVASHLFCPPPLPSPSIRAAHERHIPFQNRILVATDCKTATVIVKAITRKSNFEVAVIIGGG